MGRPATRRRAAIAALAVVALCGVAAPAAEAKTPPTVSDATYGFAFDLPAGWFDIPMTGSDSQALLNAAYKEFPNLKSQLSADLGSGQQQRFHDFAFGPLVHGFLPNINVIGERPASWLPPSLLFAILRGEMGTEIASIGGRNDKAVTVSTRIGTVLRNTYSLKPKGSAQTVMGFQYFVAAKPYVVILTISSLSAASDSSIASRMMATWRFIPRRG